MTLTDGTELAFEYNSEGLRTGKTVGNSTVQYIWNEGNLIAEIRDGYTLKFYYNNGEAAGFSYNGADYYYGKDSFGVIHYLYNTSGEIVTTYTYDAWGTVLSVTGTLAETVGTVNPVRYKSYYFDSETGWYYLQSRYYDHVVGRFLNADDVGYFGGTNLLHGTYNYNMYTYCLNNAVNDSDKNGMLSLKQTLKFVRSLGKSALKIIKDIYRSFNTPGKLFLKPFEIVIDVMVGIAFPSVAASLTLLTYKSMSAQIAGNLIKGAEKSIIKLLARIGLKIGLGVLFSIAINGVFPNLARCLTIGGFICLLLDQLDGVIDYMFDYRKISRVLSRLF